MFKQELPLMFPDDADVQLVKRHIFDPFEYLWQRHQAGLLKTAFKHGLGKIAYHAPCHQRVQNIGPKTRDVLGLIPGTEIQTIERCSGHDGTYGVKAKTYALVAQDRQTGRDARAADRARAFRQRLSDGRQPYRARHGRQSAGGKPDQPAALAYGI